MRIDEFSRPADIDGSFSEAEKSRFLLFGFCHVDLGLPTWRERFSYFSQVTREVHFASPVTRNVNYNSKVTKRLNNESQLGD